MDGDSAFAPSRYDLGRYDLSRRDVLRSAVGFGGVALFTAGLGGLGTVAQAYAFGTDRQRALLPGLRAPLRLALLTDLHYGPYIRAGSVRAWVDAAVREAPDVVLLGGDLLDAATPDGAEPLLAQLSRLRAPLGVFAVWGNHDYGAFEADTGGLGRRWPGAAPISRRRWGALGCRCSPTGGFSCAPTFIWPEPTTCGTDGRIWGRRWRGRGGVPPCCSPTTPTCSPGCPPAWD